MLVAAILSRLFRLAVLRLRPMPSVSCAIKQADCRCLRKRRRRRSGAIRTMAETPPKFPPNLSAISSFLPVRVNESRPSFFVLDSTAAGFFHRSRAALRAGNRAVQPAVLNLIGVDIPFASLPAIASKDFGSQALDASYEGTLGNDFFQRVVVEIDYARQTVRLYDPGVLHYSGQGTTLASELCRLACRWFRRNSPNPEGQSS